MAMHLVSAALAASGVVLGMSLSAAGLHITERPLTVISILSIYPAIFAMFATMAGDK